MKIFLVGFAHRLSVKKLTLFHRWSKMSDLCGTGILALWPAGAIDDVAVICFSETEFQQVLDNLQENHLTWLRRCCGAINDYIEAGMKGKLDKPLLMLELVEEKEILACADRSEELKEMFRRPDFVV
jgi:hypothetical protein